MIKGCYDKLILKKLDFLLSDSWSDYIKFKSSAIQVLGYLNRATPYIDFHRFSDERLTPYWKNRYAALLIFQNNKIDLNKDLAKLFLNDSHRFVRLKAKQISS